MSGWVMLAIIVGAGVAGEVSYAVLTRRLSGASGASGPERATRRGTHPTRGERQ